MTPVAQTNLGGQEPELDEATIKEIKVTARKKYDRKIEKRKSKKSRSSIVQVGAKYGGKTYDYVRNQDIYGQPIQLNYEGEDTYKTIPGGILSIIILFLMLCYTMLKGKAMVGYEDWNLS